MQSNAALRLMIIGKGGREHALAWKLSQSPVVEHVFVVPGNGGTAQGLHKVSNIDGIGIDEYDTLVLAARQRRVGLVVVGPDSAIVDGIEGCFKQAHIPCFAPSKEAAEIEGSKAFAKDFMLRYSIPTADYKSFDKYHEAKEYILSISHQVVIKADGLAAGKGVIIPRNKEEALQALGDIMVENQLGAAGSSVVIEEYLHGQEISVSTFSDGRTMVSLSVGQDHKRIRDGDEGPNTGGMGVYAPVPIATPGTMERIQKEILQPTFEGLRQQGRTFRGLLFTGIMLTNDGPKVLEYNARFGDPETQSVLPLLSTEVDLAEVMLACTESRLHTVEVKTSTIFGCNVVITAGGYPESYREGDLVKLDMLPEGCILFHSGTKLIGNELFTAGGRVFTVVGLGDSLAEAVSKAYEGVRSIRFPDLFYRKDIGFSTVIWLTTPAGNA